MRPGTYKILNLKSGTAMTENDLGTVGWRNENTKDQQWFVQVSGEGYRIKNVASGGYLSAIYGEDSDDRAYCGGYPTTWTLVPNPEHRGYNIYGITIGDTDRGLDLQYWGSTIDGTKIHANSRTRHTGSTHHWCWRFEYINDDQGEEPTNSTQIQQDLSRLETIIQAQLAEIKLLKESLLTGQQEFSRLTTQLEKLQPMIESMSNPPRSNNMV
ncbi:hypothetical protein RSOL_179440 [Rhizoctonia solani AG-3 Rhs1AP]|uniref:Ricin B lectin domain-containing protein n=2 Tax=Rhizoctonia solani AG-3 TaxID=1086053 RepID=A0A074RUQ4_9AGAM|nr:hypothetical protein RSOL_179440 [Rhizoctonia solani AG-3 Rhs1AP]KEP50826.1 hypothetical protein V565_072870 [Rhizoctonia solani 123E]